jgi:hypothetical protein
MKPIIRYILITASRDWLFLGLILFILIASAISMFLGSAAISEQQLMQIAYLAGSSRIILVVGMILFTCFHIRRSFDNREIEYNLSRPISRNQFVYAYFLGFFLLATLITIPVIILLLTLFKVKFLVSLLWSLSLLFELLIMSSFAILASLILRSAVSAVLACFCFYFISRIIGFAVSTIIIPKELSHFSITTLMESFLKVISIFLPRLDLFAKSKWLVYQSIEMSLFNLISIQTLIYLTLILLMSLLDFRKRQF